MSLSQRLSKNRQRIPVGPFGVLPLPHGVKHQAQVVDGCRRPWVSGSQQASANRQCPLPGTKSFTLAALLLQNTDLFVKSLSLCQFSPLRFVETKCCLNAV